MGGRGSLGHSETRVGALTEGRCCPLSPAPLQEMGKGEGERGRVG